MGVQRFPAQVAVSPLRFSFALEAQVNALGSQELLGQCRPKTLTVGILEGLAPDQEAETVLHELLHCCISAAGNLLGEDDEERAVRMLAPRLLSALRENPKLVAYLTGR